MELEGFECSGFLKEIIYGNPVHNKYDGIHLRGTGAARHFTYRAVNALKPVFNHKISPPTGRKQPKRAVPQTDFHANCPQTQYQRRVRDQSNRFEPSRDEYRRSQDNTRRQYSDVVKGGHRYTYTVPTQNKFNPLN